MEFSLFNTHLHWLLFFLASRGWVSDAQTCNTSAFADSYRQLFEYLDLGKNDTMTTYMRPMSPGKTYTPVFVDLYVNSIIEVYEKEQSLSTQVKMITLWESVKWNQTLFCQIQTIAAGKNSFWGPDLVIAESINTDFGGKQSLNVQMIYFGYTLLSEIFSLNTACKLDLYRFPFDTQICNITLQSTAYSNVDLKIFMLHDTGILTNSSKQSFQSQGEWELLNISTIKSKISHWYSYTDQLIYQITIRRRPLLHVINVMLPVFSFLVLDVTSFFIDADGADKLSFKVTLLLAISVLLLILNDTLPSTTDKVPLIGIYCSVIFSFIGISILETIFVNFLKARGADRRSSASAAVAEQDDGVSGAQVNQDGNQNRQCETSLCWIRLARITDMLFLILYITSIVVFLTMIGRVWYVL
ncbi:5-hydroxytryptamine receptor 3A [Danio aesculapii]|uniref:5-hydroxytryptamine receptor 3A n=1 Tax=Danio aesculapii TaxID=1142201 RepID=UPI0024C01CB6|nr:5-hydroxytryptamine receptor 3A [Danio aesculapii]